MKNSLVLTMKVDLGQNVRLVVSLWRFVVSSFRHVVSSCRFVVLLWRFVVSARRFLKSTRRITSSIRRLVCCVVSSFRLVHSERLQFDVHYMKCLLDPMHLYMTYLFVICYVPTEKGFFEELPTAQHRIRVKSSE